MCTGSATSDTSSSISAERLFSSMPAYNLVSQMVNHSVFWCTVCCFLTLEKTKNDRIQPPNIASEDIHPVILLPLPGKQAFTTAASKGSSTAPKANLTVNVSICCKRSSNIYCLVVIVTVACVFCPLYEGLIVMSTFFI